MVITMYKILLVEDDKNIREMVVEYQSYLEEFLKKAKETFLFLLRQTEKSDCKWHTKIHMIYFCLM